MSLRAQLPVYSPLPLRAVLAGMMPGGRDAVRAFEQAFAMRHRAARLVLTDSGTSALTLAVKAALLRRPGALVALPAYACFDLATAADGAEADVILYDLDPTTLQPDEASLRKATDAGPAAIVIVHLFGLPVDGAWVARLAGECGAVVIDDAAQGTGADVDGVPVGALGSVGVFSFGRGKGLTGGSGGALSAVDETGAGMVTEIEGGLGPGAAGVRQVATLAGQWLAGRPALYALPSALPFLQLGETVYHPPRPPNAMSRVASRVLSVTWQEVEAEADVRRRTAATLAKCLADCPGLRPVRGAVGRPGFLRFPVLAEPTARLAAATKTARALGIMGGYPTALCDLEGFTQRCVNAGLAFPGARQLASSLVTFPTHRFVTNRDIDALARWAHSHGR